MVEIVFLGMLEMSSPQVTICNFLSVTNNYEYQNTIIAFMLS